MKFRDTLHKRLALAAALASCAVACSGLMSTAAHAAAPDVDGAELSTAAATRKQLQQARTLYDLGRYAEAVAEFERVYQATENPSILYNLAQSHRRLDHHAKAAELYEAYLRKVPDAPNREEIEARVIALKSLQAPPDDLVAQPPPGRLAQSPAPAPLNAAVSVPIHIPPDPHARRHDGFFLRLLLGPHYMMTGNGNDVSIREPAVGFAAACGGAVAENVILFGLLASSDSTPNTAYLGARIRETDFFGLGGGAAYYFSRLNAYVSAALLESSIDLSTETTPDGPRTLIESEWGLGGHFAVGKEWWLSSEHGVGLGLNLQLLSTKVQGQTWRGSSGGVSISWTYN